MRRIKHPTAVASLPAVPSLTGVEGYFSNGNPGAAVPATVVPDWWLNMTQEEFAAFLTAASLALDGTHTVLEACRTLFKGALQVISASGNCTVPAGKTQALVLLWAAGGGGGGTLGAGSAASGAGAGEFRIGFVTGLTPGQVIPVTIGAGGAGGGNPGNGAAGGNSSFGAYMTAIGGGGGYQASSAVQTGAAGTPGTGGSGGTGLNSARGGGLGIAYGTAAYGGGTGGSTFMSSIPTPNIGTSAGSPGAFPGGGGNGGAVGGGGGTGAGGLALVLFI